MGSKWALRLLSKRLGPVKIGLVQTNSRPSRIRAQSIYIQNIKEKELGFKASLFVRWREREVALKQLRTHVAIFGLWVAVVRVTPYVLHYFSDHNEELKLDF